MKFISAKNDYFTIKRGAHIVVHKRHVYPLVNFRGLDVPTGSATNIGIQRTVYKRLSKPYSNCKDHLDFRPTDSIYYNLTTQISLYYQRLCYDIYIQLTTIIPNCNCSDPSVLIPSFNESICKTKAELKCVNEEKNKFDKEISSGDCPKECNYEDYTRYANSATYPTSYYTKILQQNQNVISKFNPQNSFDLKSSKNKSNTTNYNRLRLKQLIDQDIPHFDCKSNFLNFLK